ncbi:MAG: TonB-dependent receptor [Acidobacteriota bacterium]
MDTYLGSSQRILAFWLGLVLMSIGFVLTMPLVANAQTGATSASISGNVADEQGSVIKGASITVKNVATNIEREAISNADGIFLLTQLSPGMYEVTITAENFKTASSRIELQLGTNLVIQALLKVSGVESEIVEVIGSNDIVIDKTVSSTNIDKVRIDNLPINRRNFLDFSLTTARVTADRVPAQGAGATSGLSFNGQSARQNNITIDGVENNDFGSGSVRSTFSQEAIQEFQVLSDSYSAEFGRALGGVVNIVTRGGGNDIHGNLFFLNRNEKLSAREVFSRVRPDFAQYQFGATLSGPIKKDKAFFFTSFERLSVRQNNIITISDQTVRSAQLQGFALANGPLPFSVGISTFLAKADFRLSSNDTLSVRYNGGFAYNGSFEPFGGLIADTNGGLQRLDDNTIAVNNTYVNPGLNLVNETRFLYGRRDQDILAIGTGPQVNLAAPEGNVLFGRNIILPQPRSENIYQIVNNVSLNRGRHELKFGVDFLLFDVVDDKTTLQFLTGGQAVFTPLNFAVLLNRPGAPTLTGLQAFDPTQRTPAQREFLTMLAQLLPVAAPGFPANVPLANLSIPQTFIQSFGNPGGGVEARLFSAFFQDNIKIRQNLLLKAGLRYDINRESLRPDDNGNVSPRIAIAYQPRFLPKLNFHASYGVFFGTPIVGATLGSDALNRKLTTLVVPFPFSVLTFALPGHTFPPSATLPPGINFRPQLSLTLTIQPDIRNNYTQQVNTGFNYRLDRNTEIAVDYNYVRGVKLFGVRNINPVVRPVPGSALQSLLTGRVDPTRGNVFEQESAFDSYYNALTLSLNKRFSNNFTLLTSYTLSKAIDNILDFRFALQETVNPLRPRDERSLSVQDVRNRFVASGVWNLNYTKNPLLTGFQISGILNLTTGRPYNLIAGVDLNANGDNPPGDRPNGLGRNVGITPGFASFDLRLVRIVTFKERYQIQAIAEAFNIFNRVNISEVARVFPPDAQGRFNLPRQDGSRFIAEPRQFRNAFSPRQFQLGFRFQF